MYSLAFFKGVSKLFFSFPFFFPVSFFRPIFYYSLLLSLYLISTLFREEPDSLNTRNEFTFILSLSPFDIFLSLFFVFPPFFRLRLYFRLTHSGRDGREDTERYFETKLIFLFNLEKPNRGGRWYEIYLRAFWSGLENHM